MTRQEIEREAALQADSTTHWNADEEPLFEEAEVVDFAVRMVNKALSEIEQLKISEED